MSDHPWSGLRAAEKGTLDARRADPQHRFDFFYAVNHEGDYLLLTRLPTLRCSSMDLPRLRGIDLRWLPDRSSLQLKLLSPQERDIFVLLCKDLMSATVAAADDALCLTLLLTRLGKWQRLLSRGGPRLMSPNEVRGLVAELLFLRDRLLPIFGPDSVVCWKGPLGFPQDFAVNGTVFEVKSHLTSSAQNIRISSAEQLWSEAPFLFLEVTYLAETTGDGVDLCSLVDEVASELLASPVRAEQFEQLMAEQGFLDLPEYRSQKFTVVDRETFRVEEGFPRIVPTAVPDGVQDVRYAIEISALSSFKCEVDWSSIRGDVK